MNLDLATVAPDLDELALMQMIKGLMRLDAPKQAVIAQMIANAGGDTGLRDTVTQLQGSVAGVQALAQQNQSDVGNRVRWDTSAQGLSDVQKANARANIAALTKTDLPVVLGYLWPGIDPTGLSNCAAAFQDCLFKNQGKLIDFGGALLDVSGAYIGDWSVWIRNANFIQRKGQRVFLVRKSVTEIQTAQPLSTFFFASRGLTGATVQNGQTFTRIVCPSPWRYARGDKARYSGSDVYTWGTQYTVEQGNTSMSIYLGDLFQVTGLGQQYTNISGGTLYQGDVVTNAAGTVSAIVHSASNQGQATESVIFRSATGGFVEGEALMVNGVQRGTATGAMSVLTSEVFKNAARYQNNLTISKYGDTPFIMDDCSVKADGDVDSIVGSANRVGPFTFEGGVNPIIRNFTCYSAWSRCLRYSSTWAPVVDGLRIIKLPNNANAGQPYNESAYGYGIDCSNATAYGLFTRLTGGNCRHAFTTNTDADVNQQNYPARAPWYYDGCPKYNDVMNSEILGSVAEPFDTHPGDIETTFTNCIAKWGDGSGLNITASGGFKTRGFGTRYINCITIGGQIGFNDYSGMYDAGFAYSQHYFTCEARGYSQRGFAVTNQQVIAKQRTTVYQSCWISDFMNNLSTPFYPVGFGATVANTSLVMIDCGARNWNGTCWNVSNSQQVYIINFTADYRQGGSSPPRIEAGATSFTLFIDGYRVLRDVTNPSVPDCFIRNLSNTTSYVHMKNMTCTEGTTSSYTEIPLVKEENGGGIRPFYREMGRFMVRGTAAPTGVSPASHGNWTRDDECRNINPTPGAYRGWVYTDSTNGWKGFGLIQS